MRNSYRSHALIFSVSVHIYLLSSSWGTVFERRNVGVGGVLQERVLDCLGHCRGQLGPGSGGISEETGPANNTFFV